MTFTKVCYALVGPCCIVGAVFCALNGNTDRALLFVITMYVAKVPA